MRNTNSPVRADSHKQPPSNSRTDVARDIRAHADALRMDLTSLVDAALDGPEDLHRVVVATRDDWKALETSLKDWDRANLEIVPEELEWRRQLYKISSTFVKTLKRELDATFPEQVLARQYRDKLQRFSSESPSSASRAVEEAARQVLALRNLYPASIRFTSISNIVLCHWPGFAKAWIKIQNRHHEVTVTVVGEAEQILIGQSQFDIFRELTRQIQQAVHMSGGMGRDSEGTITNTAGGLVGFVVQWIDERKNLFSAPCSTTKKHVAFGAVGERGQLEARPPLIRTQVDDASGLTRKPSVKVSFDEGMM